MLIMGSIVNVWPGFMVPTALFSERVRTTSTRMQTGVMRNARSTVKEIVDSVAAVRVDHRELVGVRVLADDVADVPIARSRTDWNVEKASNYSRTLLNGLLEALICCLDEGPALGIDVANKVRLVEIAMHTTVEDGDINYQRDKE
jgi:hypothetical protein